MSMIHFMREKYNGISSNRAGFLTKGAVVSPFWIDVIGAKGAGKTRLIRRIVDWDSESAIDVRVSEPKEVIPSGQLCFRENLVAIVNNSHATYYTDIVLCCYDKTDNASFNYLFENFLEFEKRMKRREVFPAACFIVVATKCDMCVEAHTTGQEFAEKEGVIYIETSAATGMGCKELRDMCLTFPKRHRPSEVAVKEQACCRLS